MSEERWYEGSGGGLPGSALLPSGGLPGSSPGSGAAGTPAGSHGSQTLSGPDGPAVPGLAPGFGPAAGVALDGRPDQPRRQLPGAGPSGGGHEPAEGLDGLLPTPSLPRGGGTLEGLDEKLQHHPFTGTASFSIPVAVSPGRGSFQPTLSLGYDSGSGNSLFGLGWSIGIPAIRRKTAQGLPQYGDSTDTFMAGAEDLVPALVEASPGQWEPDTRLDGNYRIDRYRPRTEGAFTRIERWSHTGSGTVHWRTWSRDGVLSVFGYDEGYRVTDPDDPARVFSWLIQGSRDPLGNTIAWDYKQEDTEGAPLSMAESTRGGPQAARHPKRCCWSSTTHESDLLDFWTAGSLTASDWLMELVFDYGEHDATAPLPDDADPWLHRADAFSNYRSGFELRTRRLCRRLLLFHRLPELHATEPTLVRSLDLDYDERPEGSLLVSAQLSGYVRDGAGGYDATSRPPLEFGYTERAAPGAPGAITTSDPAGLPTRLGGSYRLLDLDGEGLPGLLRADDPSTWTYRRNLGDGVLGAAEPLPSRPTLAELDSGRRSLADVTGTGRMALVQYGGSGGFHARQRDGSWASFRPFSRLPNVDWEDPSLRFVDLSGNGRADLLITENEVFRWYPSCGEAGFGAEQQARLQDDEDSAPRVVFTDPSQAVLFADMTGDGLADLVRVRRAEVCFWPSLGFGRFGAKVILDDPPMLTGDGFDPRRVRLLDADGTGPSDLLYLEGNRARLWFNRAGNSWSDPLELPAWPLCVDPASVQVADVLGTGTSCLVWEPPTTGDSRVGLRFLPLVAPGEGLWDCKPNLLQTIVNNLGAETTLKYRPSTAFYREARDAGRPWATRLAFPVQVVSGIKTVDLVQATELRRSFAYHHGFYDAAEREFRGFGRVDAWDAESFAKEGGPSQRDERSSVRTQTWFHTGAFLDELTLGEAFGKEYYAGDETAHSLPHTLLPPGLSPEEKRQACRALKGTALRVEVYAEDDLPEGAVPYAVTGSDQKIEWVQPSSGDRPAVFFPHARETLSLSYERKVDGGEHDPRVQHQLVLATDDFGNVTRSASIAYARRATPDSIDEQETTKVVVSDSSFVNVADQTGWYRVGLPFRQASYELTREAPSAGEAGFDDTVPFDLDILAGEIDAALAPASILQWQDTPDPASNGVEARRLSLSVTVFREDEQTSIAPLPLGEVESLALPFRSYSMVLPAGLRSSVFGTDIDSLAEEGGYRSSLAWLEEVFGTGSVPTSAWSELGMVQADNSADWWSRSGQATLAPSSGFYLPVSAENPWGESTQVAWDSHHLVPRTVTDPLGNVTTAHYKRLDEDQSTVLDPGGYRVLQPLEIADPNGNRSQVALDGLGRVVQFAYKGAPTGGEGDSIDPTDPDAPTARWSYDLDAWATSGKPASVTAKHRQEHGGTPAWEETISYFDGLGRVVCSKQLVESGLAPDQNADGTLTATPPTYSTYTDRWVGTGRTIYDNKGAPVRQYEPYFSSVDVFEDEADLVEWGISPILTYDPPGRVVRVDHPDGSFETTSWDAWSQTVFDRNDNCRVWDAVTSSWEDSAWYTAMVAGGAEEQRAAREALNCVNTPAVVHLDCLGRPVRADANNNSRWPDRFDSGPPAFSYTPASADNPALIFSTHTALDVSGNPLVVTDARDVAVQQTTFDMAGAPQRTISSDAGWRKGFAAVDGQPVRAFDERGYGRRWEYDVARRTTHAFVTPPSSSEELSQRIVYGDEASNPSASNLLGRVHSVYDGAGLVKTTSYSFRGLPLDSVRRLAASHRGRPDWSELDNATDPDDPASVEAKADSEGLLEASSEAHETSLEHDALGRTTSLTTPDENETLRAWNVGGLLESVSVLFSGDTNPTPYLTNLDYDERGRRTRVDYAPGTYTEYDYDPDTLRLKELVTKRAAGSKLQEFSYFYDAVGNITSITDGVQQTTWFDNAGASPDRTYGHDPLGRMIRAMGREDVDIVAAPGYQLPSSPHGVPNTSSPGMRAWLRDYTYDPVGNIAKVEQTANGNSWTRDYVYETVAPPAPPDPLSNRLASTTVGSTTLGYDHDAHGSIVVLPHLNQDGPDNVVYDHGDRMVETVHGTGAGTYRWYYQYDASGQRVRKVRETSSGNRDRETVYVGNWERYREYTGAGSTVDEEQESLHLSDDRRRFALLEIQVVTGGSSVSNFVERYQLGDHLGTSVLELTASENVLTYEEYYPYGTVSYTAETTSNPGWSRKRYRFTAMERDEETGLQYHHHRYYMPWLGRWTRPDPAGVAAGTNRYAYVAGNPVKRWDASGLVPPTEERVVARAIDRSIKKALATPSERAVSEAEFRDVSDRWVAQSQDLEEYAFSAPVETLYAELATIERGAPDYLDSLSSTQADTVFEARSEIGFALRVREAEHELRDAGLDPREVRLTLEGAVERFAERFSELSVHGRGEFNTHIISLQTQHGQFFGFLDDDKSLGWFEGWEGQAKDPPGKGTPEAHIHTHWLIPPGGVTTAYKATVSGPDETTFSRVLEPRGERMFVVNPDGTTSEIVRTPSGPVAPTPFLYAPSVSP